MLPYEGFRALGAFIVNNMEFLGDAGRYDYVEEGDVPSLHIGVSPVLQWGN